MNLLLMCAIYLVMAIAMTVIIYKTKIRELARGRWTLFAVFGIASVEVGYFLWRGNTPISTYQALCERAAIYFASFIVLLSWDIFFRRARTVLALISPDDRPAYWGYKVKLPYFFYPVGHRCLFLSTGLTHATSGEGKIRSLTRFQFIWPYSLIQR